MLDYDFLIVAIDATHAYFDRSGRVDVQLNLSLAGYPEVFVIGNLARVMQPNERLVPGITPAAMQMGAHVAAVSSYPCMLACLRACVLACLHDRLSVPFRYRDSGNLATIGRMAAVVHLAG